MPNRSEQEQALERVAQELAMIGGASWERMNNYPGYAKAYWRDKALAMMATARRPLPSTDLASAIDRLRDMLARREFDAHGAEASQALRRVLDALSPA